MMERTRSRAIWKKFTNRPVSITEAIVLWWWSALRWMSVGVAVAKSTCVLGHRWTYPIVANLDSYWMKVGRQCIHCGKYEVAPGELKRNLEYAYSRGKTNEYNRIVAYAAGLDEILRLYPGAIEARGYVKKEKDDATIHQ